MIERDNSPRKCATLTCNRQGKFRTSRGKRSRGKWCQGCANKQTRKNKLGDDRSQIYALFDKNDPSERPRYIGVTRQLLEERVHQHRKKPINCEVKKWREQIGSSQIGIKCLEVCQLSESHERELFYIRKFDTLNKEVNLEIQKRVRSSEVKFGSIPRKKGDLVETYSRYLARRGYLVIKIKKVNEEVQHAFH